MANAVRVLLVAVLSQVVLAKPAIFIDRSGSLNHAYENGFMETVYSCVAAECRGAVLYAFGDQPPHECLNFAAVKALQPFKWTYVDLAADKAVTEEHEIAWIITDNVQDEGPSRPPGTGIEKFYRYIADDFGSAVLLPVRAPSGSGLSGLIVYAFARTGEDTLVLNELKRQVGGFVSRARDRYTTEAFPLKPFDEGAVEIVQRGGSVARFNEDVAIKGSDTVIFHSARGHINIVDAGVVAHPASVVRPKELPDHPDFKIAPPTIQKLDASDSTTTRFVVTYDFGRYLRQGGAAGFFRGLFAAGSERYTMSLPFDIVVQPKSIRLSERFLADWNARSDSLAKAEGKILGLEQLTGYIAASELSIPCYYKKTVEVVPPGWYLVLLLVLIALLLGLCYLVYWLVKSIIGDPTRKWDVFAVVEGSEGLCQQETSGRSTTVFRGGQTYGRIDNGVDFVPEQGWDLVGADSIVLDLRGKDEATADLKRRDGTAARLRFQPTGGKKSGFKLDLGKLKPPDTKKEDDELPPLA